MIAVCFSGLGLLYLSSLIGFLAVVSCLLIKSQQSCWGFYLNKFGITDMYLYFWTLK